MGRGPRTTTKKEEKKREIHEKKEALEHSLKPDPDGEVTIEDVLRNAMGKSYKIQE